MERILVPLDGSRLSETVLPLAEALARDYSAELILLRAVTSYPGAKLNGRLTAEAKAYLARIAEGLQARGLAKVRSSVAHAKPDQAIAEAAQESLVDLIAMTTHGRGGVGRLLFGSVAETLVRQAPAPVLLVRGEPAWRPGRIAKILVPLDGSQLSEAVLPMVGHLAGPFDLSILLLHAVEPVSHYGMGEVSPLIEETAALRQEGAQVYLSKVAGTLEAKGLRVQAVVRIGPAVDVIQECARREGIGLIAMTTHGRTGWGRLFFGSVTERTLRETTLPVLLWKPQEAMPEEPYELSGRGKEGSP